MTDYEYIIQQVKRAHYSGWDDEVLRKCVELSFRSLTTI